MAARRAGGAVAMARGLKQSRAVAPARWRQDSVDCATEQMEMRTTQEEQ